MMRLAVPNKGRLRDPSIGLLAKVGITISTAPADRSLVLESRCGRYRILSVNARDIPRLVAEGAADGAITGTDLVAETGVTLPGPLPLGFGESIVALAIPESTEVRTPEELPDGIRVASVFPRLTAQYFRRLGKRFLPVAVSGAVEAAPALGVADAIVDVVETGATLRGNRLRPLATLFRSQAAFVLRPGLEGEVARAADELRLAIESVARAQRCRYLMANVPQSILGDLPALLPGVEGPTILPLLGRSDRVAVHAVVEADAVNGIVAMLQRGGATGILIASLERMVL